MQLVGVLLGSVAVSLAVVVLARVRIALELSARGEPDGSWAGAFGVELGPLALTGVAARGVAPKLELHALGRRFDVSRLAKRAAEPEAPAPPVSGEAERPPPGPPRRLDDAGELVSFALAEWRRFRLEALRIELGFGFRDIALTGKIVGALYVLAGVLPRRVTLIQIPRWDGVEAWQIGARGSVGIWPGLVLGEVLWYMLRRARRRRFSSAARAPATPATQRGP